jgi:phage anti-repressor protein
LVFFSNKYLEDKSVINHNYLHRYLDFKDLVKRISRMFQELLKNNELLDSNEAVRIIKIDNAESLRFFSHGFIKRHITTK